MRKNLKVITILIILLCGTTTIAFASNYMEHQDKLALFKDIKIEEGQKIIGDIMAMFADIKVDGTVSGDVVAIFGEVNVEGTVDGDAVSIFGSVRMGSNSTVTGDRVQIITGTYNRPRGSIVRGEEVSIFFNNFGLNAGGWIPLLLFIFTVKTMIAFLLSVLLIVIAPERMDKISDQVVNNLPRNFGIGLLVVVGYYMFTVLGAMIIIGIPLIPILVPLMTLLGFTGNTAVKYAIGRKILKGEKYSRILQLFVGTLIYWILELTLVLKPILYLAKIAGIGAVVDTKIGTVNHWGENKEEIYPAYSVVNNTIPEKEKQMEDKQKENNQVDNEEKDE